MKSSNKNILKSVVVLLVITVACVGLLSLANTFLKTEITLNEQTVSALNELCPTGVSDEEAYNENYFVLVSNEELSVGADGYSIKNYSNGSNNKLLAVYYARKGESAGRFILETSGSGQYALSIYTAFKITDDGFAISAIKAKSETEDKNYKQVFSPEYFEKFIDAVVGKNQTLTQDEIIAVTGATTKNSARGLSQALTVAVKGMDGLYRYADTVSAEIEKRYQGGESNE